MKPLKLDCPEGDFNDLWEAFHKSRASSETIRVPRAALGTLLLDHGRALARLEEAGERVQHFPGTQTA